MVSVPNVPAEPFRAALERARAAQDAAKRVGEALRAEAEQRAQGAATGQGPQ